MKTFEYHCLLDPNVQEDSNLSHRIVNLLNPGQFGFSLKEIHALKRLPGMIMPEALDLLYLSLFVFAVDRRLSRDESDDSWSRNIHMTVPVLCVEKWRHERSLLEKTLNFLSGDYWSLDFYQRRIAAFEEKAESYFRGLLIANNAPDTVCLLSGGLDSFIGAIDLLESSKNALFVSQYGGGKGVKEYQDKLITELIRHYKLKPESFLQFYAAAMSAKEDTTRSRSLLFFGHAVAVASCIRKPVKIIVPENGLISLNIPLTHSRLGSSSTRTTHPYYMKLLQKLANNLGLKAEFYNPYQFQTKGEMMLNSRNKKFLARHLNKTMSCSHPDVGRMKGERHTRHCGYCFPCLIRRAAIKHSGLKDTSGYRDVNLQKTPTAATSLNACAIGVNKFDKKHVFLKIQNSGPIEDAIPQYADLYSRGMEELKALLGEIHAP
jgi:7-cyano-7-deazaguanine synthase in queuosine biosynthesis